MTGQDAEIICGEWETGTIREGVSGEKYNIILDIKEIVRHPDYTINIESSAFLQNDIAVFKVNDNILNKVYGMVLESSIKY